MNIDHGLQRAYSVLTVKGMDDEKREISGMATTPTPDRVGDVVEPLGVIVAASVPLFLYHDLTKTVGRAQFGKPNAKGIPFTAKIPKIAEPGALRDRLEEAWQLIRHGLVTGVSIGFRPFADQVERMKDGGLRFLKTEILELSIVPVPANAEATITSIKMLDERRRIGSPPSRKKGVVYLGLASKGNGVVYLDSPTKPKGLPVVRLGPNPRHSSNTSQHHKGAVHLGAYRYRTVFL